MSTRIWKPSISYGGDAQELPKPYQQQQDFGPKLTNNDSNNVRVSLQHQPLQEQKAYGFNPTPRQFGSTPTVKLDQASPTYLRSEALKMINETEKVPPKTNNNFPPECFTCGRMIIGLMCNAFDKNLHPDCFQCSTCGSSLAQQGHHFINDKFYCDVHGKQRSTQSTTPLPAKPVNSVKGPPLKNSSRPFNTLTNTYQNPENVVQPSNRFGQSLVQPGNASMKPQTPTGGITQQAGNFAGAFNRSKIPSKSPAFQRRRKLQKQWPPVKLSPTQKNAQAVRFWKYNFQQNEGDKNSTTKTKMLIDDFETGKVAEMDSKIIREESSNYAKRVVSTPDRLNSPMRLNPFAWSNAHLPSSAPTSQPPSSVQTPMSSSLTLEPMKTISDSTNQSSCTQPSSSSNMVDAANPISENHTETSWKFLSQIIEEQDIMTDSTISSLKSSLSLESSKRPSLDKKPDSPPVTIRPKPLNRMMSIQIAAPQIQIRSSTSQKEETPVKEESQVPAIKKSPYSNQQTEEKKVRNSLDEFVEIERAIRQVEVNETNLSANGWENDLSEGVVQPDKTGDSNYVHDLIKPLDDICSEHLPAFIGLVGSGDRMFERAILPTERRLSRPHHQKLSMITNPNNHIFEHSSRESSTEMSSLADLPIMPDLVTFNGTLETCNSQLSNRSIDDCLRKTGDFLTFLTDLGLVGADQTKNRRNRPETTWEFLDKMEEEFVNPVVPNKFNQSPMITTPQSQPQPFVNPPPSSNVNGQQHQVGQLPHANGQIPLCESCQKDISGSFVLATGKTWCVDHFNCANPSCNRRLLDCGFVEESGKKYCEKCFETLIAPSCAKCRLPITADCLNALQKQWHPECFVCVHCRQTFGNTAFYLENGQPYCERDWNQIFTTKCSNCRLPIEAGDRWIEAIGSSFHSNCFNCFSCQRNLEGENFYARDGHPFCRAHA